MAKIKRVEPEMMVLEFHQEQEDEDYGTCLWARFVFDLENTICTFRPIAETLFAAGRPLPKVSRLLNGCQESMKTICSINYQNSRLLTQRKPFQTSKNLWKDVGNAAE